MRLESVDRGFYRSIPGPTQTASHDPRDKRYTAGHLLGADLRDYFVFDAAGVGPCAAGRELKSATLTLRNTGAQGSSPSAFPVTYSIFGVPLQAAVVSAAYLPASPAGFAVYDQLAQGPAFAATQVSPPLLPASAVVLDLSADGLSFLCTRLAAVPGSDRKVVLGGGVTAGSALVFTQDSKLTLPCSAVLTLSFAAPPGPVRPLRVRVPPRVVAVASSPAGAVVDFQADIEVTGGVPPYLVLSDPPSGSLFPVGRTAVTTTATDAGGTTDGASFPVIVAPGPHRCPASPPPPRCDRGSGGAWDSDSERARLPPSSRRRPCAPGRRRPTRKFEVRIDGDLRSVFDELERLCL